MLRWAILILTAVALGCGAVWGILALQNADQDRSAVRNEAELAARQKQDRFRLQSVGEPSEINLQQLPRPANIPWGSSDPNLLMLTQRNSLELESPRSDMLRGSTKRELIRQAILLAGREELGLATRDASLGEDFPHEPNAKNVPLEVLPEVLESGFTSMVLFRPKPGGYEELFNRKYLIFNDTSSFDELPIYPDLLAVTLERLSRDQFVAALKQAGFSGEPNTWQETADVPEEVRKALADFNFGSQLQALRHLHRLMKEDAESPERLSALARGYANLATLTDPFWGATPKVYRARAMLYAQRLFEKTKGASLALQTRAYVRALVGRPQAALDDIKLVRSSNRSDPETAWLPVVEAYCSSDRSQLEELGADGSQQALARYLLALTHDTLTPTRVVLADAEKFAEICPDGFRVEELSLNFHHAGAEDARGEEALAAFLVRWPQVLGKLQNLPPEPASLLKACQSRAKIGGTQRQDPAVFSKLLREADDRQEPSLAAAAQILDEWAFLRTWRILWYDTQMLGRYSFEDIPALEPLFAQHRYAEYLRTCEWSDYERRQQDLQAFSQNLAGNDGDLEWNASQLVSELKGFDGGLRRMQFVFHRLDRDFARDLSLAVDSAGEPANTSYYLDQLKAVAPDTRATALKCIQHQWDSYGTARAPEWETRFHDDPLVLEALGKIYLNQKQYQDAERVFLLRKEALPEASSYFYLAYAYDGLGDANKYKSALLECLKKPTTNALERGSALELLCRYMMRRGEFEIARIYAEEAAKSDQAESLECAAECLAACQEWEKSEGYAQRHSELFPESSIQWFRWCVRFGRGDLPQAEERFRKFLESRETPDVEWRGFHAYATGQRDQARLLFGSGFTAGGHAWYGLEAAMLYDAAGDSTTRDQLLRGVSVLGNTPDRLTQEHYAGLARWMIDDLAGRHTEYDAEQLRQQIEAAGPGAGPWLARFLGHYLMNRQRPEDALPWLQYAATSPLWRHLANAMTAYDLREMNVEIESIRYPQPASKAAKP